jgi:hypothetical protein
MFNPVCLQQQMHISTASRYYLPNVARAMYSVTADASWKASRGLHNVTLDSQLIPDHDDANKH